MPYATFDRSGRIGAATRWLLLLMTATAVWFELYVRVLPAPSRTNDTGVFVSIAARLRAGDILYTNVTDNKDPLFYWVLALFLGLPYGLLLCELMWIAVAGASAAVIARRSRHTWRISTAVGLIATPLVLTGSAYEPGMSHLPGTALALACLACALSEWWAGAGVLLLLTALAKLIALPVLLAPLVLLLLRARGRGALLRLGAGTVGAASVLGNVLAARLEWPGYFRMQAANVTYAQGQDLLWHRFPPFVEHLTRMFLNQGGSGGYVTVAVCALAAVVGIGRREALRRSSTAWILAAATGTSFLAAVLVLGLTALWAHHGQLLYIPGVLAMLAVAAQVRRLDLVRGLGLGLVVCLLGFVAGGGQPVAWYPEENAQHAGHYLDEIRYNSPESAYFPDKQPPRTFAHLGPFDKTGFARGFGSWTLVCPRLTQYAFDPDPLFDELDACLPRAQVIFVDASFPDLQQSERGKHFVSRTEELLDSRYACEPLGDNRVCTRR